MIITNLSEFPAIPTRKDLSVEEVALTALQNTGVGLVSYSLKVGDTVEFPDNKESIRIMSRQVSKDSDSREMLLAVHKNGNPSWFSIANLRRWDAEMHPVHPVAEALRNDDNDEARVLKMLGKKITAKEEVTYNEAVFVNRQRTDKTKSRTVAKLIFVE
jgi:hypothetical protein